METADDSKVNGKVSVVVVDSPEHGRSSAARPQQQTSEKRADRRVPPRGSTLPLGYVSDYINRGALAEAQHLAPAPLSVEVAVGRWGWHRGRATRCGWRRLRCTGKLPLAAADGAGVLVLQPRVDAHEVEVVRTLRTPSARVLRAGVRCAQGRPVTLGRRRRPCPRQRASRLRVRERRERSRQAPCGRYHTRRLQRSRSSWPRLQHTHTHTSRVRKRFRLRRVACAPCQFLTSIFI